MTSLGSFASHTFSERLIADGGVLIDGVRVTDPSFELHPDMRLTLLIKPPEAPVSDDS